MRGQWFLRFFYAVRNSLKMSKTEFVFSISSAVSICIITGILTGFVWFYVSAKKELSDLLSFYRIVVFINNKYEGDLLEDIKRKILEMREVKKVRFLNEEEVMALIKDVIPVPQSFLKKFPVIGEVELKSEYIKGEEIEKIAKAIENIEGVSYVDAGMEGIDRLVKKTRYLTSTGLFVLLFTAVGGFVIVYAFTNLTLYSVKEKIEILKYVGAPYWFLRLPFILRGVIVGVIGSSFTFIVLHFLPAGNVMDEKVIGAIIMSYGFLSGFAGSLIAMRSHRL